MVTRLPFPFFGAVAALWFSPDYLTRERQEFKEEGHSFNPRTAREKGLAAYGQTASVYPLVRPRGVSAHFVRFSSGDYIIGIGEEKTLEISVQYDIMEKLKFQCLASLCSQGVLFLPCGIDEAEKQCSKPS